MRRALAARHEPPRALPLRLLPAPVRAALGVPELRRSLDDRAHVRHRERHLPQLRRLDALAHLTRSPRPGSRSARRCRTAARPSTRRPARCCSRPRAPRATPIRTPSAPWPQPCGIETTPGMMSSVVSTGASSEPAAELIQRGLAVGETEPLGVVGMDVERAALLALHERRQVVHPRVVRAQLAAADQHHPAVALARHRRAQAVEVGDDRLGRQLDLARRACAARRAAAAGAARGRSRAGSARAGRA